VASNSTTACKPEQAQQCCCRQLSRLYCQHHHPSLCAATFLGDWMAHLCGHTAVLCPFMRTNMCLLPFPAVCSPLSGTCPGKISAVYCKEDAKGRIRDIAYSNPKTGLQLVGCASGDWTAAASKSLELAGNENIIEVKTCRNNPRLVRNGGGARCRARKQPRGADCCCLDFGAARASNRKTALWHTAIT
jgi:hypothetical protein